MKSISELLKKEKSIYEECDKHEKQKEQNIINTVANALCLKLCYYNLEKRKKDGKNAFQIFNNLIYFYPLNDGYPTCGFEFYQNGELIIDNAEEYSQISNLDDIILQMVRIFNQSLDKGIVLDPYYFMLELTDKICKGYNGSANLIITEKAIRNQKLNNKAFNEAQRYFINHFLDHFIGWNFGLSVNRNETLKQELEELNEKVIDMGIREYAGDGFEVSGTKDSVVNGLQRYILPIEKDSKKPKIKHV